MLRRRRGWKPCAGIGSSIPSRRRRSTTWRCSRRRSAGRRWRSSASWTPTGSGSRPAWASRPADLPQHCFLRPRHPAARALRGPGCPAGRSLSGQPARGLPTHGPFLRGRAPGHARRARPRDPLRRRPGATDTEPEPGGGPAGPEAAGRSAARAAPEPDRAAGGTRSARPGRGASGPPGRRAARGPRPRRGVEPPHPPVLLLPAQHGDPRRGGRRRLCPRRGHAHRA